MAKKKANLGAQRSRMPVSSNPTLPRKLVPTNISRNSLGSDGASSLAEMLRSPSCALEKLDIAWNCCSGRGTVELGEALRHHVSIQDVSHDMLQHRWQNSLWLD